VPGHAYPSRPGGPCTPWCLAADVFAFQGASIPEDADVNAAIEAASWLLWSLSGRQFSGGCIQTVRPCRTGCGCWGPAGPGGSPGANGVNLALAGADWWFGGYGGGGLPGWTNDCGDSCGCGTLSTVTLDGYPVTAIQEVLIDGDVVDPATYRLDGSRYLVRLVDPSSGDQLHWPACQNMARPPTDHGTWQVTYEYGSPPPALGVMAAAELAVQFFYASTGDSKCKLPSGVTKVVRQGITIERLIPMFVKGQRTGLVLPDAFLAGVNPNGLRRRPAVMSPGVPRYPRRTTT
jgi:hypothetical protein